VDSPVISIVVRKSRKKETQDSELLLAKIQALNYAAWKAYLELKETERAWLREIAIVVSLMDDGLSMQGAEVTLKLHIAGNAGTWETGRAFTLSLAGKNEALVTGLLKNNIWRNIRLVAEEQLQILKDAIGRLEDPGIRPRVA
jgi:hypothetical protein